MARQFVMSMYVNKEDLYKDKAEYWEKIAIESTEVLFQIIHGLRPDEEQLDYLIERTEENLDL
jgi:hypothetical protein